MTSAVGLDTSTLNVRALLAIALCMAVWPFEPAAAAGPRRMLMPRASSAADKSRQLVDLWPDLQ